MNGNVAKSMMGVTVCIAETDCWYWLELWTSGVCLCVTWHC